MIGAWLERRQSPARKGREIEKVLPMPDAVRRRSRTKAVGTAADEPLASRAVAAFDAAGGVQAEAAGGLPVPTPVVDWDMTNRRDDAHRDATSALHNPVGGPGSFPLSARRVNHSSRSAIMGSIRAARRAGTSVSSRATSSSRQAAPPRLTSHPAPHGGGLRPRIRSRERASLPLQV